MVKIDLITGFLGAGKTTFIKKYVQYLLDKGMQIGILENDFGAVNVDMMLLQNLMGEGEGLPGFSQKREGNSLGGRHSHIRENGERDCRLR